MSYIRPGVYIQEKYTAGGAGYGGYIIPCIVGKGLTNKRIWDEEIERSRFLETIVPNGSGVVTLTHDSTEKKSNSKLYKNGIQLADECYAFTAVDSFTIVEAYRDLTATWSFSYLATDYFKDDFEYTPLEVIYVSKAIGGARSYRLGVDYTIGVDNKIDWSILTAASFTGIAGTFDLHVDDKIKISVDGKTPIEVTITGAVPTAVTAAEVVADINVAALAAWGVSYGTVASVVGLTVKLTSVVVGEAGRINFYEPASNDATDIIFDVSPPAYYIGTGVRPAVGAIYYTRYNAVRPADAYDKATLFYSYNDAFAELGPVTRDNDLLIAIELCFLNGAAVVGAIQVRDIDDDGIYMFEDWTRALDSVKDSSQVTDLVLLNTNVDVLGYAVGVIEDESSLYRNHWMGGWFGCVAGASIGDPDTADTIVYTASRVLQVAANSGARGRFVLAAPPSIEYQITETDMRLVVELTLDSTFLAAALVGMQAGLSVISDSLLRRQVIGLIPSSVTLSETEAAYMASQGVCTVVNTGGKLLCFDPVTTDKGGDELYSEPNIRPQKDYLANKIRTRLDSYCIGVVPDDVDDFLYELKANIAIEIDAAIADKIIAPYRNEDGKPRGIDMVNDIKVYRSQVHRTEYRFMYWFAAKWVVKRIFGEYVVDSPLV